MLLLLLRGQLRQVTIQQDREREHTLMCVVCLNSVLALCVVVSAGTRAFERGASALNPKSWSSAAIK
jgi:hypothetical protein